MNGIIIINKEKGFTSNDIIIILKKILKIKKIGHSGTLDPFATGVLVVGVGDGTKLLEYIINENKIYEGEIVFGYYSNTQDITGKLIEAPFNISDLNLNKILKTFHFFDKKTYMQKPPMYSSVKVNGKKLYQYAFEEKKIDRKKRKVNIFQFKNKSFIYKNNNNYCISFVAKVSKGTYIRTLCVDFGKHINIPCVMGNLNRISVGNFLLENSYKLNDIKLQIKNKNYNFCKSLKFFIESKMPVYKIDFESLKKISQGKYLENRLKLSNNNLLAYSWNNEIVSICKIENDKIKIVKNLNGAINEIF